MVDYITVQLPSDFVIEMIDPMVKKKKLGYSSRAEVVKEAVRNFIELKKKENE